MIGSAMSSLLSSKYQLIYKIFDLACGNTIITTEFSMSLPAHDPRCSIPIRELNTASSETQWPDFCSIHRPEFAASHAVALDWVLPIKAARIAIGSARRHPSDRPERAVSSSIMRMLVTPSFASESQSGMVLFRYARTQDNTPSEIDDGKFTVRLQSD